VTTAGAPSRSHAKRCKAASRDIGLRHVANRPHHGRALRIGLIWRNTPHGMLRDIASQTAPNHYREHAWNTRPSARQKAA
jgi:hypothetical protein